MRFKNSILKNSISITYFSIPELAQLPPEDLIDKIKSMHDEIYQLGLREAMEMTRGKLLGIFDRDRAPKRQP